jgi:hypothetical protein
MNEWMNVWWVGLLGPCTATHSGLLCFPFWLSPQQSCASKEALNCKPSKKSAWIRSLKSLGASNLYFIISNYNLHVRPRATGYYFLKTTELCVLTCSARDFNFKIMRKLLRTCYQREWDTLSALITKCIAPRTECTGGKREGEDGSHGRSWWSW